MNTVNSIRPLSRSSLNLRASHYERAKVRFVEKEAAFGGYTSDELRYWFDQTYEAAFARLRDAFDNAFQFPLPKIKRTMK